MQQVTIAVKTKKDFIFNPNKLMIRIISTDIVLKTAEVYYELTEDGITTAGRNAREWVDKGNVTLPLNVISNAYNADGTPNPQIINAILNQFNLEILNT